MSDRITVEARMDRSLAWNMGDSRRYLHLRLTAPPAPAGAGRGPMNVALVVDASGSMGGAKLAAAKQAAIGALAALRAGDRLTVVSFAEDVQVHVAALEATPDNRRDAGDRIRALTCRGMTNLSEGWFRGVLTAADGGAPGAPVRAILLSDGHANAGITAAAELSRHAAELLARGVVTSTLGIGDGYDEGLLAAIAEHGGGRLLDAEQAGEIGTVLLAELDASASTILDAITVAVDLPQTVQAEPLGLNTMTRTRSGIELQIGSLIAGQSKDAVIALQLPRGDIGAMLAMPIRVAGRDPATGDSAGHLASAAAITYAPGPQNTAQPRDIATSEAVARAWHAEILRRLAAQNRDGAHGEAEQYLKGQIRYFARYAEGLPEAERLIPELELLRGNIGRDWNERTRKEMVYAARRVVMSQRDFRGEGKASWLDHLRSTR